VIVTIGVLAILGAAAWWRWGRARGASGPKIETVKVDRGAIEAKITATGALAPLKTVLVGSQVSGRIADVLVDFNAQVTKGQVIARLDPQLFKAAVEQAEANLSGARAELTRAEALAKDAKRQYERTRSLAERKLVSQSEADTAESQAEAQAAQVIAARGEVARAVAAKNQAELNLSYTTITSPIDGVVISRDVDVGQTVAASLQAPTLFTIAEDLRKMQVNASISESDVGKLSAAMRATFTVDAFPQKKFEGTVREVRNAPKNVQNVVTYDAIIDVGNPELELRPGMTANVTIVYGDRKDVVRVPNAALRFRAPADWWQGGDGHRPARGDGERPARGDRSDTPRDPDRKTVWRLESGVPRPVKIKIGLTDGSVTEVLEGELEADDAIVTELVGVSGSAPSAGQQQPGRGGGGRRFSPL
jgi:HlyD family secretion protein